MVIVVVAGAPTAVLIMGVLGDARLKSSSPCLVLPGRTVIEVRGAILGRRKGRPGETYVVAAELLLLIELRLVLVDTRAEVGGVATERDVEILQEGVAASEQGFGLVGVGANAGLAVEDNDTIGEVGGHDEVVLDDESSLLGVHDEALDDTAGDDTLLGIKVCRDVSNGKIITRTSMLSTYRQTARQ